MARRRTVANEKETPLPGPRHLAWRHGKSSCLSIQGIEISRRLERSAITDSPKL